MNVAFIPVRGGSKSIPLKNIKLIAGHPLVYWTAKAANDCRYIDVVYVATDSREIAEAVRQLHLDKVKVIGRAPETASDTASTESAMLEFAANYQFDNIVLIQATSPLLTAKELEGGFELYETQNTDSVLSVVRQRRFCWKEEEGGTVTADNYDIYHRPRRQEFEGYLVENGAFYITGREKLLGTGCRISGNIRAFEMDEATYFEIDEPSDWIVIEEQLKRRCEREKDSAFGEQRRSPQIKMFLTDCDGVLTDGGMYYSENGDELKKFNTRDGMGLRLLKERGIITGVITGEERELNRRRCEKLGIDEVHQGVKNKLEIVKELCNKYQVSSAEVLYVGDDINDLPVLTYVGFPCCVADAHSEVREAASYICENRGGGGAIREIADFLLHTDWK